MLQLPIAETDNIQSRPTTSKSCMAVHRAPIATTETPSTTATVHRVSTNWLNQSKDTVDWIETSKNPSFAKLMKVQSKLAMNTKNQTMGYCLKYGFERYTTVTARAGKVKVYGVNKCNSPLCASCSSKRAMEEAEMLATVFDYAAFLKHSSYFLTFNKAKITSIEESNAVTRKGMSAIRKFFNNLKMNHNITVSVYGIIEDTFEKDPYYNGIEYITRSHNHLHTAIIFHTSIGIIREREILKQVCNVWNRTIKKCGSYTRSENKSIDIKKIDLDPDTIDNLSGYLSKMISATMAEKGKNKMSLELSHSQSKIGKGRSFYELLKDIAKYAKECDVKAYRYTVNASYQKKRVFKNQNYKDFLEIAKEWKEERARGEAQKYLQRHKDGLMSLDDYLNWSSKQMTGKTIDELQKEKEETISVDVPRDVYDYIGFRGANPYLLELFSKASLGKHTGLFEQFRDFCVDNTNYSNKDRRSTTQTRQMDEMIDKWRECICLEV